MLRLFPLLIVLFSSRGFLRADDVYFEKHVRPILKAHCFHCHGEAGETEGGLDLRLKRFMAAGGDSGTAVVDGKPNESLMLQRVRSGEMPPGDDKHLSPAEIKILQKWIAGGAKTAREEPTDVDGPIFTEEERSYWAFQPVQRPDVPTAVKDRRARTPIDAFILARQSQLAPDADSERLLRRAYFDLTGLPPSPAAIDAFVNDSRSTAWQHVVDGLLASPHYGERWARHWLDVVGYADSEGYTDDDRVRPHAWRYRDYVIRAFNSDKPFDRFVQEQLAGDEMVSPPYKNLSPDAVEKLTATGYLRMAPDGTASGGIDRALAQNQVIADTLQIVGTSLLGLTVNCAQCHDHRYDPIPTSDYYRLRAIFEPAFDWKNWRTPAGRQISLYTDDDRDVAAKIEAEAKAVEVQRQKKAAEYITRTLEEELLLIPQDKREATRIAYRTPAAERSDPQKALLKDYPSVASISVGSLYLYDRRRDERAGKLDAERKAKTKQFVADATRRLGVKVTEASLADHDPQAAAELKQLADRARELRSSKAAEDLKKYAEEATQIRSTKPEEGFVRALSEVPGRLPATFVFYRGDHEQPRDQVAPGDLSILNEAVLPVNADSLPTTGRRLAFAKYLTSGRHPLLARVIVNRIWLHHFGRGLVDSPGDFGVLGSRPTHPQLLDWLAAEFVDSGWSVKHIHRLIMRSTVYRQASQQSQSPNADYDGYPLRRLESEVLRDAILSVSGLLNRKQFGKPVPVMQDAVGQIVIGQENLDGERKPTNPIPMNGEEFRRSIYIQVRRTRTLSMFEAFDAPTLSPNCEKRSFSTATPQSLLMMNSDFALKYSEAFADRIIKEAKSEDSERVTLAWRLAFGVRPDENELHDAVNFVTTMKAQFSPTTDSDAQDKAEKKSYAVFCQALLSSNRFLYVE